MSDIVGRRATTKDFSNCMTYESAGAVAIAIIITVSVQNTDITDIQEAVNKIYLWISNTITNLTNYVIDSLTYVQRKIKYEGKRIASRKKYTTKKAAKEAATLAGHKTSPIHHPDGEHGPHYHPNLPKGNPHAHDHYYYNYLIYRFIFKEWLKHE